MNAWEKKRKEYSALKRYYYHLSSDGWKEGRLFHSREQYAYGMTLVGLLTLRFDIVIYDFTLMPNHIHLLLKGDGETCMKAFDYFRRKLSARLVKDGNPPLPADYGFKLRPVESREQMRVAFLYLARNPYERNTVVPGGYLWASAGLHYSDWPQIVCGTRADCLSKRTLERLTGTRMSIPGAWEFHPQLGLLPSSFVDHSMFEKVFASPKDYQTHLVKEYEAFVRLGRALDETPSFSEEEIADMTQQLVNQLFPGKRSAQLSNDEKGQLCVRLADRYGLSPQQMGDELHMPERLVKQFLSAKDYGNQRR